MTIAEIELWASIEQILGPGEYRLFVMYHTWKMSQGQIAGELGISQPAVCRRMQKITKKLRRWL